MYFAAQAMAAELSTGILVMDRTQAARPQKVSMLVYHMQADFQKKATGTIRFKCEDGQQLDEVFNKVLSKNDGQTITLTSVGRDEQNDIVSTFSFTWTLKEKK